MNTGSRKIVIYALVLVVLVLVILKEDASMINGVSNHLKDTVTYLRPSSASDNVARVEHVRERTTIPPESQEELVDEDEEEATVSEEAPADASSASEETNSQLPLNLSNEDFKRLQKETISFVQSRRKAHEEVGMAENWWLRGLGYLWEMQNTALAMAPLSSADTENTTKVRIINVHPSATGQDCEKLSIWVRVRGPEIIADLATAVDSASGCYWELDAKNVRVAGEYAVDAKVLSWNTNQEIDPIRRQCNSTKSDELPPEILEKYPHHAGFKGFKVYTAHFSCCEFCSRLAGCVYWSTPPLKMKDPGHTNNGCELFFDDPNRRIPRSHILQDLNSTWGDNSRRRLLTQTIHGTPHNDEKIWFLGCGWSQFHTLDFPCMSGDLDDKVYATNNTFVLSNNDNDTSTQNEDHSSGDLPICNVENEFNVTASRRWVRKPWPTDCPTFKYDTNFTSKFAIVEWVGDKPHCWHRDDLTKIGHTCIEMNCRFIREQTKYFSPLREKEWMGVWKDRACDYYEYTDDQLQKCFDIHKIESITREGQSISLYLYEYVQQRVANLKFYEGDDGVAVVVSTLGLFHKCNIPRQQLIEELAKLPNSTDSRRIIVPNSFFLSSERESMVLQANTAQIAELAVAELQPRGYTFFDVYDASKAFTFDTATQMDGMHAIGPTMKLLVTKFFHYLCKDVVEGSRM